MDFLVNTELGLLLVALIAASLGGFAHYCKKWMRREIDGSLIDYLFRDHFRDTLLAMSSIYGSILAMYFAGQFVGEVKDGINILVPVREVFQNALLVGYILDSALNKAPVRYE